MDPYYNRSSRAHRISYRSLETIKDPEAIYAGKSGKYIAIKI